jgi:hypothetical protein
MIVNLHPATFADILELQKISLSGNGLIYIHPELLMKNRHLQIVHIANNRIRILPLELFKYNNNLTEVYVNGNEISFLSGQQFQHNPELKALHLEENNIIFIHADTFRYSTILLYVNLSHNEIRHIQSKIFQNNCQLKIVDLSNNKLETISSCQPHCLKEVVKIIISGNPLVCDSDLEEVSELCNNYTIHISDGCDSKALGNSARVFRGRRLQRAVHDTSPLSENTSRAPPSSIVTTSNSNDTSIELRSAEDTEKLPEGSEQKISTYGASVFSDNGSVTVAIADETELTSSSDETEKNVTEVNTLVEYDSPLVLQESTVRGFLFIGMECLLASAFVVRKLMFSKDQNNSTVADTIELLSESEPKSEERSDEKQDDEV